MFASHGEVWSIDAWLRVYADSPVAVDRPASTGKAHGLRSPLSKELLAPVERRPETPSRPPSEAASGTPHSVTSTAPQTAEVFLLIDEHSNLGCLVDDNVFFLASADGSHDANASSVLWDQLRRPLGKKWPGGRIPVIVSRDWGQGEPRNENLARTMEGTIELLNEVLRYSARQLA